MVNWRELGEVPDSEDESAFDSSQEPDHDQPDHDQPDYDQTDYDQTDYDQTDYDQTDYNQPDHDLPEPQSHSDVNDGADSSTLTRPAIEGSSPVTHNVWDVPFSSQSPRMELEGDRNLTPQPPAIRAEPETTNHLTSSPLSSLLSQSGNDLEKPIQISGTVTLGRDLSDAPDVAPTDTPKKYVNAIFEVDNDLGENEESFEQGTEGHARSLRPRKPIQEHPYLLESAQYSKTLRSHGVRPLRVQLEEAARKQREEEDSQEQDYHDESQSTAKGLAQEDSGESQGIQHPTILDNTDEEEVAPASSPSSSPERTAIRPDVSLRSSQDDDDDELPDPADIHKWKLNRKPTGTNKRKALASPKESKNRKVPKLHQPATFGRDISPAAISGDIFDIPPSPPQTSPNFPTVTPITAVGQPTAVDILTPKLSSVISSRDQSPAPANRSTGMIDLTMVEDEGQSGDELSSGSGSDSGSDREMQQEAMRRKMRGVLPASWLRLDEESKRQKSMRVLRQRSPDRSPDQPGRNQRKGVAQRRQISPRPSTDAALFLDDSDDDDDDMTLRVDDLDGHHNNDDSNMPTFEDDAGSVVEDNQIDHMASGKKRSNADKSAPERQRKRRKTQQSTSKGQPGQLNRQQRITGLLNKSNTTQSDMKKHRAKPNPGREHRTRELSRSQARSTPPPRLSILDVLEPNAPSFIRIAARTANGRSDKGRSSPSSKQIALGTRKDNIEAIGVLRDWKRGRIQPRVSSDVSAESTDSPRSSRHLSHSAVQSPKAAPRSRSSRAIPSNRPLQPPQPARQARIDSFVTIEAETPVSDANSSPMTLLSEHSHVRRAKPDNVTSRPAQLETSAEIVGRHAFDARKRALDAVYRKSRRALPLANICLERLMDNASPVESLKRRFEGLPSGDRSAGLEPAPLRRRPKLRKHFQPQRIDTTAPQYAHANDPLPSESPPISSPFEATYPSKSIGKLLGLGPFGTHYTQHFEIFPLDYGVFFHESTPLGSGRLVKASTENTRDSLCHPRGVCTFTLDEKTLRWGQWDAQASSELGIVFDWIIDCLCSDSPNLSSNLGPVQAAEFVLEYLQNHIWFPDEESEKHFVGRALEILQNFTQRLETIPSQAQDRARPLLDVLSHSLITSFQILRICHDLSQVSEIFQLEEVLKTIAERAARELLTTELVDIRNLYHDLQHSSFRERGVRNEHYSMVCWVILIRVLEEVHIPRSGFWDVVSAAMLDRDPSFISDAHTFERIWHNLFSLLPLGEFDNTGVLVPGMRHIVPLEGWGLPQKLIRRVFQLYETNPRQAPSFNDYCRGVVSRCHYLIEQWGWRRSNGIIGAIFDFFASQGLSHLRNEEVYRSPEFLEHLAEAPSLAITPQDRCFHIFLKLLALSIKRLESHGMVKDARNLLARVLPNHNRQYDKEKDIRESDLAALRNHHDLLCTLFWAAPPGLRPSVQTIEKLVLPGNSHKEACLISLRAWSQLSRFVISSGGDHSTYKPFADWQRSIFQQVLEQYLSAESDIQQQLSRMPQDASRNISRDMMNAVVKLNRKGAMDVLHFSMKGFLGVVRHAPTLGVVSFALNNYQLDQVFTRLPVSSADFDWSSLRAALDILDYYVTRIEEFLKQDSVAADHSWHGEDAIMLLERKMAAPFFSMARNVTDMDFRDDGLGPTSDRAVCMEQAVSLAGRLAARLVHARLSRLSQFFMGGKYSIFPSMPRFISAPSRKYLALFLAVLIEQNIVDFKDSGGSLPDLFLLELIKPWDHLAYENRLALAIQQRGDPYLEDAVIDLGDNPGYDTNRDLFSHIVAVMRKTLRRAETGQKPQLQLQFSKTLKSTMDQMKLDLKSITFGSLEHEDHIEFVRSIVSIIRSQDICPVDSYFYQISREYSPSRQDPRLQIASILSLGLKLEEGDSKAVPGLFYLLFPNFKLALANNELSAEKRIIRKGMENPHVLSFMLSTMFPAIIITVAEETDLGWILLATYVNALEELLTAPCIHRAIGREDMDGTLVLIKCALGALLKSRWMSRCGESVMFMTLIMRLLILLSPSLEAFLSNEPTSQLARGIASVIDKVTEFARESVQRRTRSSFDIMSEMFSHHRVDWHFLCTLVFLRMMDNRPPPPRTDIQKDSDSHAEKFASHMIQDIQQNWVDDDEGLTINVKGPSKAQGQLVTQSGQGTQRPYWSSVDCVRRYFDLLTLWMLYHDKAEIASRQTMAPLDDYLF
ncbi:Mus7/MMS22 family-domain-containing protein [Hypoxylon sp. NC1633]|nr:Mus7/MMS22 family-domain-containing protein [Hypoxylon sp. NC1633]